MVADEDTRRRADAELALGDLENALVRLDHAVVLGEDHRLEVAPEADLVGQPAPVGQQSEPVARPQRVEAGDDVGKERRVPVPMIEVGRGEALGQLAVRSLVAALYPAPSLEGAAEAEDAQAGQVELDPRQLLGYGLAVILELRYGQRVGERAGTGGAELVEDGQQRIVHHALEVPQRLVPVEEDGFDHLRIRRQRPARPCPACPRPRSARRRPRPRPRGTCR